MNATERYSTFALASIFALRMLGLFMIVPVFAIAGQQYDGATPALLGLAVGVYGLTQAILQIPFSLWSDYISRRALIVVGLLLFALGNAIAAMSVDIWQVIIGRAIAGSGAISAVVMALLADVTREEQRGKAMAVIGMSIGASFMLAFILGPLLTAKVGLQGLFWFSSIAGILAILLLLLVPRVSIQHKQTQQNYREKFKTVLNNSNLNRLHVSIFMLHLIMTALFVFIPSQLVEWAGIPVNHHGWVYLPLLLISVFFAFPSIIVAEKKKQVRQIFIIAVGCIAVALGILSTFHTVGWGLLLGLALFFIAFNVIEALLPSWLSKIALPSVKATAMGINASSQFLGAFFGGVLGGQLLASSNTTVAWLALLVMAVVWLGVSWFLEPPRYLTTLTVELPKVEPSLTTWSREILALEGVEEVAVLQNHGIAYVKVDEQNLDEETRQKLSLLLNQAVVF
ncbi:MFS transporter [Alkanindiges sp. WGS2144]|uniref:MFS transporter n=1 Tax=Alkanindiges sp. WGS2144 TaxID=3366808 RepID=UPI003751337C